MPGGEAAAQKYEPATIARKPLTPSNDSQANKIHWFLCDNKWLNYRLDKEDRDGYNVYDVK